jgi:hypothetical protein
MADPSNMRGKFLWTGASINRRHQKILLEKYPAKLLPPSRTNPVRHAPPIVWSDGTVITWKGSWKPKAETSLYASRRLQANGTYFKGTKAEREAPAKKAEREERMAGMAKRIEEFRKVSGEARTLGAEVWRSGAGGDAAHAAGRAAGELGLHARSSAARWRQPGPLSCSRARSGEAEDGLESRAALTAGQEGRQGHGAERCAVLVCSLALYSCISSHSIGGS